MVVLHPVREGDPAVLTGEFDRALLLPDKNFHDRCRYQISLLGEEPR
jgi:hypothetical protein